MKSVASEEMSDKPRTIEKILYLPVETVVRDLDAIILNAYEALKRGYRVVIGSISETDQLAKTIGSGTILTKHWEKSFPYTLDSSERENFFYVGFHPEGLVFKDQYFGQKLNVTGKSEKLDLNFVYGVYQKQLLEQVNKKLAPILKAVGHPRFDLLREDFHYLYSNSVESIRRRHGSFVLVNTNFTPGNTASFYDAEYIERKNRESVQKWGKPLDPDEVAFLKERIDYYKNLVNTYISLLKEVAPKFPDFTFIVRPHPSENHDTYHSAFSGIQNIRVVHKGSVIDWILASEVVIQTGCTTAIETWACKKPLIRFNPDKHSEKFESSLPNQFGHKTETTDELIAALEKVQNGSFHPAFQEQLAIAKPYIESIDGERSVERMMDYIDELYSDQESVNSTGQPLNLPARTVSRRLKELKFDLLRYIRTTGWLMKWRHGDEGAVIRAARYQKMPGIRKSYLINYFKQLSRQDKTFDCSRIEIRKVDVDTFFILYD